MPEQIVPIVATAVLSSLLTVGLAGVVFRRIAGRMEERLEARLQERLAEIAEEVGETIEARLRSVVRDAVRDFKQASLASGATRTVATTGAELVQEGLRILMGGPPRSSEGPSSGGSGSGGGA